MSWAFIVGYVIKLPVAKCVASIDKKIQNTHGKKAALTASGAHPDVLAIVRGTLLRTGAPPIRLHHVFVELTPLLEEA